MYRFMILLVLFLLVLPAYALGDTTTMERHGLVLNQVQLWSVVIGVLSPLVAYVINTKAIRDIAGRVPEPIAALIHVLVAGIGAALYQAATTNTLGFNDQTLQVVLTAVVAAFAAHGFIWKPAGVQAHLTKGKVARG